MTRLRLGLNSRLGFGCTCGGGYVDSSENTEDIGLYRTGEQTEQRHDDGEDEGRDREKNSDDHDAAHHVTEETNGQGQCPRELTDDIEWQHDHGRLDVCLEIAGNPLFTDSEQRNRDEDAQREGCCG